MYWRWMAYREAPLFTLAYFWQKNLDGSGWDLLLSFTVMAGQPLQFTKYKVNGKNKSFVTHFMPCFSDKKEKNRLFSWISCLYFFLGNGGVCSRRIAGCVTKHQFFCGLVCDLSPLWTRRNSRRTPPITPPPPFCLRRSRQIREKKVLFFFLFFFLLLLGDLGGLFSDLLCTLKKGASRENYSLNGCIKRKLFFKMGVPRENIKSLSFTEIRKRIIMS